MKFPVLWSGLCCYTEGWGGKCSEILATIKLLYNPRVNKVFTHSHSQKRIKCFLPTLHWEKLLNPTITAHLVLRSRKTWTGKSRDYCDVIGFSKYFPSTLKHKAGVSKFLWFEACFRKVSFSWQISVDGRLNRRNKAAFSNTSGAV